MNKCTYCDGKGFYSRCYDKQVADDFGGEGYTKKAIIVNEPCKKCNGTGTMDKVLGHLKRVNEDEGNVYYLPIPEMREIVKLCINQDRIIKRLIIANDKRETENANLEKQQIALIESQTMQTLP